MDHDFESFVKACQAYFSVDPHGKKVEIAKFKALSTQDKVELSAMLNSTPGFSHPPYEAPVA